VPPGVAIWIAPAVAPDGTLVVISIAETTVNGAAVPLKLTLAAPVRFVPRIVTGDPTGTELGTGLMKGGSPTDRL